MPIILLMPPKRVVLLDLSTIPGKPPNLELEDDDDENQISMKY